MRVNRRPSRVPGAAKPKHTDTSARPNQIIRRLDVFSRNTSVVNSLRLLLGEVNGLTWSGKGAEFLSACRDLMRYGHDDAAAVKSALDGIEDVVIGHASIISLLG